MLFCMLSEKIQSFLKISKYFTFPEFHEQFIFWSTRSTCFQISQVILMVQLLHLCRITHSPPQRLSHRPGENHVKTKKRSLCNKMCGSWHVQQQQSFGLEKHNFYSDALGRFCHGARRLSREGSFSGFRQVSYSKQHARRWTESLCGGEWE